MNFVDVPNAVIFTCVNVPEEGAYAAIIRTLLVCYV